MPTTVLVYYNGTTVVFAYENYCHKIEKKSNCMMTDKTSWQSVNYLLGGRQLPSQMRYEMARPNLGAHGVIQKEKGLWV